MYDKSSKTKAGTLEKILLEAHQFQANQRPFLAVFDLDSTLFDLTLRVSAIVDQFAQEPEYLQLFPEECERLKELKIERSDWGLGEPLSRIGIFEHSHQKFFQEIHRYWTAGFFSNNFLHHDLPLPGAVDFVQQLQKIGPMVHIMYLTGRDIPRMKSGTEESLKKWNFPLEAPTSKLVLKPSASLDDAAFKVAVLRETEKLYERIWLFENEPVNLNLTAKHCPEIQLVFIESTHSGREEVSETLDRITHFEIDLIEFEQRAQKKS